MKFFITSEAFETVGKKMNEAYVPIGSKIESLLRDKQYGDGVIFWGHICISCPSDFYKSGFFKEIKKYTKKNKEVEMRLRIDYEMMLDADQKEVFRLICESILKSIDIAEKELKIKSFDFIAFRNDLKDLFKQEGWI